MVASVFIPPGLEYANEIPALYWLSGLTCTDENFCQKSGAFAHAARHRIAVIVPDTSPRGAGVDGEDQDYDLGTGAGFYVDATAAPWSANYRMHSYITKELPALVEREFKISPKLRAISGHSMGGHGALTIALKNPSRFQSVSAFAPICAPMDCPWGQKAFQAYLGDDEEEWGKYDTCALIEAGAPELPMLIDQGLADEFLDEQLLLDELESVCELADYHAIIRRQQGYDHSYYFVSTFIDDHLRFHAQHLGL